MKTPNLITATTILKRGLAALFAAVAALAITHTQALAGGPSLLQLPVEGITAENQSACAKLLREKLGKHLSSGRDDVTIKDGGYVQLSLNMEAAVTLERIEKSLAGSEFKIDPEALMLVGVVRIEVGGASDADRLAAALRPDDKTSIEVARLRNGNVAILLENQSRHSNEHRAPALRSYRELKQIIAQHGAKVLSVGWGTQLEIEDEDFAHWFCRDAFGARRIESSAASAS